MAFLRLEYIERPISAEETPQSFFDHLRGTYACLLESGKNGRYSYIAYDPFLVVWSDGDVIHALQLKDFFDIRKSKSHIMEKGYSWSVQDLLGNYELKGPAPVPFCGGAAGYLSYDFGSRFVGIEQRVFDDAPIPAYVFGFYDKVIAFDHQEKRISFLALAETDIAAKRKLETMQRDVSRPIPLQRKGIMGSLSSNLSREAYVRKVAKIKEYLRQGDTYQVNFSQRFSGECTLQPWTVYKKLAQGNPSPFACYFEYPEMSIVSCSPELLLRKRGRRVETWPIKGTVPRGATPRQDDANVARLLNSTKDQAELSMIVDLARNDLGKVCRVGSVRVDAHRDVEQYSHVIHTVSRVSGELEDKVDIAACLRAVFPGGSVTGCPKQRTMEIIDHLEDYKRGVYTGSAGYIGFGGDADFNILIRTMLLKDDNVSFHAGGGIVMDSDPDNEYQETLDKVEALRRALD